MNRTEPWVAQNACKAPEASVARPTTTAPYLSRPTTSFLYSETAANGGPTRVLTIPTPASWVGGNALAFEENFYGVWGSSNVHTASNNLVADAPV